MKSPAKLLRECTGRLRLEKVDGTCLRVFDFDDTLVKTDAKVYVTDKSGKTTTLTPSKFAVYDKKPGDTFDYSEFQKLINPRTIRPMMKLLNSVHKHHGSDGIVILSARSISKPIKQFMKSHGYSDVEIVALDSANPHVKATWISNRINKSSISTLEFFDDSHKNVAAVKELREKHSDVKIHVHHVVHGKKKRKKR